MQPLDSLSFIDLKPYSAKESHVHTALKERNCFKVAFDSANIKEIKKYSEIFAKAGAHILSMPANISCVEQAKAGIEQANINNETSPQIMVSLSLDHALNPQSKRKSLDNLLSSDTSNNQSSKTDNITQISLTAESLSALWNAGASYIEIHVGENFAWLEYYIRKIKELSPHPWMISIVVSGQSASYCELQRQAIAVHELLGDGALVQVDGTPAGQEFYDNNPHTATLRALASASAILETDKPIYVQISGNMNDTIKPLLSRFGIKVHGVTMGNYPQQLLGPHLDDTDTSVAIAKKLVKSISQ